jgi:biotin carboxyl carrier protein
VHTLQYLGRTNQGFKIRFQGNEVVCDVVSAYGIEGSKYEMPPKDASMDTEVLSPMTGRVKDVLVKVGDTISLGQQLLVLEAMKMLNPIVAERSGIVARISVEEGAQVNPDDILIEFE